MCNMISIEIKSLEAKTLDIVGVMVYRLQQSNLTLTVRCIQIVTSLYSSMVTGVTTLYSSNIV